jgi:Rod binding domain-containing protein
MRIPMEGIQLQQASLKGLNGKTSKDLKGACEGFEAYLVLTLLNELQKTTNLSEKSSAEQTYFSMLNEKVAQVVAKKGIGVKDMLLRYLQGSQNPKVLLEKADNTQK